MKNILKAVLLGLVAILSFSSCSVTSEYKNAGSEISISTQDVDIIKTERRTVVTTSETRYYFHVEATCAYENAEIYGLFSLMDLNDEVLETTKETKASYVSQSFTYVFNAEIKESTSKQYVSYSAIFKGSFYVVNDSGEEFFVGDEYITATNLYVNANDVRLGIKSLYNLTYLSYRVSLYFDTYAGSMQLSGEISERVPANKEYMLDLNTNINFAHKMSAFAFEDAAAKTKDTIDKNKKFNDKMYTYVFLDLDDHLFDFRTFHPNTSSLFDDGLTQSFISYPYLTFRGYKSENGIVKPSFFLPKATKNLVFRPEIEINETKFVQKAEESVNVQKSCLKVSLEYYDTVLGFIQYTVAESHGSGVVIGGDKSRGYYALTNYHVVQAFVEKDYSGHEGIAPKVIDYDKQEHAYSVYATDKRHDLALIRFSANKTIYPATIGFDGTDELKYNCVMAIGCPNDSFLKISTGPYIGNVLSTNSYGYNQTLMAHMAETHPGSSGGPVFGWKLNIVGLTVGLIGNESVAVRLPDIRDFIFPYRSLF